MDKLRKLIEQSGKSQTQVAKELGISPPRLNYYVQGRRESDNNMLHQNQTKKAPSPRRPGEGYAEGGSPRMKSSPRQELYHIFILFSIQAFSLPRHSPRHSPKLGQYPADGYSFHRPLKQQSFPVVYRLPKS